VRISVVSDIHGSLTALEAVVNDLRQTAPDVVISASGSAGARRVVAPEQVEHALL
jgi:hypothetical protein